MKIEKKDHFVEAEINRMLEGFSEYDFGVEPWNNKPFQLIVRDDDRFIAGAQCSSVWGWMHVKLLWVEKGRDRSGLGTRLMAEIETEARQRGCLGIHLDTFDFQAPSFYRKLGYEVFGQIEDHPPGHTRYFMKKRLD